MSKNSLGFQPNIEELESRELLSATPLPPLLAQWSADDTSKENVSGIVSPVSPGISYTENAVHGKAFSLLQYGAGITVPAEANVDFERTQPFSISGWARINSLQNLPASGAVTIFEKGEFQAGTQSYGMAVRPGETNSIIDVWLQGPNNNERLYWRANLAVNDTEWHHYTLTYDGSAHVSGIKVFMDGKELSSKYTVDAIGSASIRNPQQATVGKGFEGNDPTQFVRADIDSVRVYGSMLTPDMIAQVMADDRNPPATVQQSAATIVTAPEVHEAPVVPHAEVVSINGPSITLNVKAPAGLPVFVRIAAYGEEKEITVPQGQTSIPVTLKLSPYVYGFTDTYQITITGDGKEFDRFPVRWDAARMTLQVLDTTRMSTAAIDAAMAQSTSEFSWETLGPSLTPPSGLAMRFDGNEAGVEGINGNAMAFGPGKNVTVPTDAKLEFHRLQPFTIGSWARANANDIQGEGASITLFEKGENGKESVGYVLRMDHGKAFVDAWIQGSTVENRIYWRSVVFDLDDTWHHYAFTYDGSGGADGVGMLRDDVALGSRYIEDHLNGASPNSPAAAKIGSTFGNEARAAGAIDGVRVYAKKLSPKEIAHMMANDIFGGAESEVKSSIDSPQGRFDIGAPGTIRMPGFELPALERIARLRTMEMAELQIVESAEQIARRVYPYAFVEGASQSTRLDLIWSVQKELGTAEDIISSAAEAAMKEWMLEKMDLPNPAPNGVESLLSQHPRMSVIGFFGIIPTARIVRNMVRLKADDIYKMQWQVKSDENQEKNRLAHQAEINAPVHTPAPISPEIHKRIMDTILNSQGTLDDRILRVANYVKANQDAMAYIPTSVRVAVEAILNKKEEQVAAAGTPDSLPPSGIVSGYNLGPLTAQCLPPIQGFLEKGKETFYEFTVQSPMLLNVKVNTLDDQVAATLTKNGTVLASTNAGHGAFDQGWIRQTLLPGTYRINVKGEETLNAKNKYDLEIVTEATSLGTVEGTVTLGEKQTVVKMSRFEADGNGNTLTINPLTGEAFKIDPNKITWIVIHGRGDKPDSNAMKELTTSTFADATKRNEQIITLNWEEGAKDNFPQSIGLQGNGWIEPSAEWVVKQLKDMGFTNGQNLRIESHSWGTFFAYEIAKRYGKVGTLIALDPAQDLAALGSRYDTSKVNFGAVSSSSFAFSSSKFGNESLANTAQNSIKLSAPEGYEGINLDIAALRNAFQNRYGTALGYALADELLDSWREHGFAVTAFSSLIRSATSNPTSTIASHFSLGKMSLQSLNDFKTNANGFEGTLVIAPELSDGIDGAKTWWKAKPQELFFTKPDGQAAHEISS